MSDYVAQLPEPQALKVHRVVELGKQASGRIEVRFGFGNGGNSYLQKSGSGVFVSRDDGAILLLTAGHTFEGTAADLQVKSITSTGQAVASTLLDSNSVQFDFAVMRCDTGDLSGIIAMTTAEPHQGDLVIALGYPDQCGVNAAGQVARGEAYMGKLLEPLTLLLEVTSTGPLLLSPVAGALPLGGFSGGGLFNLDGQVIGVLTGVQWEPGEDSMDVLVTGCSVSAMRASL